MEVFDGFQFMGRCYHSQPVDRHPGCDQCTRTRLINKCKSDCDSIVDKHRPYRSRSARSRYVNVCAAVCLLLLVGGRSPQSSAAPHRRSRAIMERQNSPENRLWANPCDYNDSNIKSEYSPEQAAELVPQLVKQAKNAYASAAKYKNAFALELHSFSSFDKLLREGGDEWLRQFKWFREEVLPKEKVLYSAMPDEYMNALVENIDEFLPAMYKALKMIVAGLYAFSKDGLDPNIVSDEAIKENINQTMHDVRAVLCLFSDLMKARNLEIPSVPDNEIPSFTAENKLFMGLHVYRDTLNYLEYITQVFQKLHEIESA